MTALLTLTRRELAGHFFSLRGYVIMAECNCCLEPACSRWCICSTGWRMICRSRKISTDRILLARAVDGGTGDHHAHLCPRKSQRHF